VVLADATRGALERAGRVLPIDRAARRTARRVERRREQVEDALERIGVARVVASAGAGVGVVSMRSAGIDGRASFDVSPPPKRRSRSSMWLGVPDDAGVAVFGAGAWGTAAGASGDAAPKRWSRSRNACCW
jgi:hypothetical protein